MSYTWTGKKFDGKCDVIAWLRKFGATLDLNEVEDQSTRYKTLISAVHEDVVLELFEQLKRSKEGLPSAKDRSFSWLEKALIRRFGVYKSTRDLLLEFSERKMLPNESVEEYVVEKRERFFSFVASLESDKHWKTEDSVYFLEDVIEGLPKKMQFQVKTNNPPEGRTCAGVLRTGTDLQGVQEKTPPAVREERYEKKTSDDKSKRFSKVGNAEVSCYHCGEKGHIKWQCPKLKDQKKRGTKEVAKDVAVLQEDSKAIFMEVEFRARGSAKVSAQVDTGASSTTIDRKLAEELSPKKEWLSVEEGSVKVADGRPARTIGRLQVSVKFPGGPVAEVSALILESVLNGQRCLLGRDALAQVGATIDCAAGVVLLPREEVATREGPVGQLEVAAVVEPTLKEVLEEMKEVFNAKIGTCTVKSRHHIPLTTSQPVVEHLRRTSGKQDKIISRMLQEMLDEGVIEGSKSEYASAVVLARKKDNSWRFCVDYRKLNAITRKDPYPLPRIDEILDSLGEARVMSKMDLQSGFWQIPVAEEDRHKTAFVTKEGTFQFKRMPFGLTGAPATFQRAMNECLSGLVGKCCFVYLDDIIIYSKTEGEHAAHMREVLSRLRTRGFVVKQKKCVFAVQEMPFLGHLVGSGRLSADPQKVDALLKLAPPKNEKQLRSFLGSVGYFRRFIAGYAIKARPLTELTKQGITYEWREEQQKAYDDLLGQLMSPPVLRLPDFGKEFLVRTDASDYAVGGVLMQEHDGQMMPVAFYSKKLTKAEKNYTTTEKEALAVVRAIKQWWFYLDGRKFVIETDHSALRSVLKSKEPTGRIARWVMRLSELEFEVRHRPGSMMVLPDMLSRQDQILALEQGVNVAAAQRQDVVLGPLIRWIETGELPEEKETVKLLGQVSDKLIMDEGKLFYYRGQKRGKREPEGMRLALPSQMRVDILKEFHDMLIGGHFGVEKTFARVQERYWWPNQYTEVKHYVETCEACAQAKRASWTNAGKLETTVVGRPWQRVSGDFLGPVERTERGNRYLLVFADYFTRWMVAVPTVDCTADTVAKEFVERVVLNFGAPEEFLSDNGSAFASEVVDRICAMTGTKKIFTTAYRPQANGLVERWNGTVVQSLRASMDDNIKGWDDMVSFITFAYNTSVNAETKMTPFELVQGRTARMPVDVVLGARPSEARSTGEYSKEMLIRMQEGFRAAKDASDQQKRARERRNQKGGEGVRGIAYKQGDKVWLDVREAGTSKLNKKFEGPYDIVDVHNVNYVTIIKEDGERVRVHVGRLKPCKLRNKEPLEDAVVSDGVEMELTEVDPDLNMLPNDLIGKRVRVWWSGAREWFDGTVMKRKKRLHVVHYDDGDVKAERLLGYHKKISPKWKLLEHRGSDDLSS
jgi:transposase InsO family protein